MADDNSDTISLGTGTSTWAIKGFSTVLREQITKAARTQDATTAEWLHRYFQRFGIDGVRFDPVQIDHGQPQQLDIDRLIALASLDLPKWLSGRVNKLIGDAIGAVPPVPPRHRIDAVTSARARLTNQTESDEPSNP